MSKCFHGGAFWEALGPSFQDVSRRDRVVNADVLDAWFPPSPRVVEALCESCDWLARTSPPATHAEGVRETLSRVRGIPSERVIVGPGSSSLIFAFFRTLVSPGSRILLVEPTYGEYEHVARLLGCEIDRVGLQESEEFRLDIDVWIRTVNAHRFDTAVLVNPNNPVGAAPTSSDLSRIVEGLPTHTKLLVDEAYIDYTSAESCETYAATRDNVFVVKSLSKGLALSGMRVAYLVGPAPALEEVDRWTPPWSVSLPAQVAAVHALEDPRYYDGRYRETAELRQGFARDLRRLGGDVWESPANWVLWKLPVGQTSKELVRHMAERGVFLRDAGPTAPSLRDRFVRIAVLPALQQHAILSALGDRTLATA